MSQSPEPRIDDAALGLQRGSWYLWDYERNEIVRGPYKTGDAAGAVRREIEGDRNLWIVSGAQVEQWREELARAR